MTVATTAATAFGNSAPLVHLVAVTVPGPPFLVLLLALGLRLRESVSESELLESDED